MLEIEFFMDMYEAVFNDGFPSFMFLNSSKEEIIKVISECIEKRKNVYELGILELDKNVLY